MGYEIIAVDGVKINHTTKKFPVEVFPEQHALDGPQHTGLLNVNQLPSDVMLDSEHQLDPHTMIIDGRDVSVDGAKLDTIEFNAEVNNLTDQQAQSLTSGAQSNWHTHDDWYYRKTEFSTAGESTIIWDNLTNVPLTFPPSPHNHDDRYYTETEINTMLSGYSLITHNHDNRYYTQTLLDGGQLDNRYYTEPEVDAMISSAAYGIKGSVDTYADLPTTGLDIGDIYIVKTTVGSDEEGFYRWDGSNWSFLANNTGSAATLIHNNLSGLNLGDYKHLTAAEYSGLTGGNDTSLHTHNGQYYTENEINNLLDNYYTKIQLDGGQLNNIYYTETETDTLLANKSDIGHIHDDRYYTETEVDAFLANKSDVGHNHDGRYYTETEMDTILNGYSLTTHNHDNRYFKKTELSSITDGSSGADIIGATAISGGSATTVQGILEELATGVNGSTSTLDEAYDNGGSGLGREITVDSAPVKLNATSTDAPLELTNKTVAPTTNLSGGQISVINNILYIYDGARSKWLTPSKLVVYARNNNSDGSMLSLPGGMRDWRSGIKMLHDGTILGISVQTSNAINNKTISIEINGNESFTVQTDVNGNVLNNSLNHNFDEGDYINIYVYNQGHSINDTVFTIELAWRV